MKFLNRFLSYFLAFAVIIPSFVGTSVSASSGGVYPADGAVYYESPGYFVTDLTGYEKAVFELDGVNLGEADSEGKLVLSDGLSFGAHTLKTIKIAADKSTIVDVANFKVCATTIIKQQHDIFDDFDPDDYKSTLNYAIDTKEVMEIVRVPGASGEANDYAFSMRYELGKKSKSSKSYFQPGTFKQYGSGISEAEFDIKFNTPDTTIAMSYYMINGAEGFGNADGKWIGTDIAITPGEWTKLKFFIDADHDKYDIYINGNKELSGVMADTANYNNFRIRLSSTIVASDGYRPGIEFDNFHAVNKKVYTGISKMTYVYDETETDSSLNIPADASIKVYVEEGLNNNDKVNNENITLRTMSGISIPLKSVSYNDSEKSLTLVPDVSLPQGETIEVCLNETLSFADNVSLGGNHCIRGTVAENLSNEVEFKLNGAPLHSSYQLSEGDVISADITVTNTTDDKELGALYLLTERKDGRLISMSAKTLPPIAAGQTAPEFTLTLPKGSAGEGSVVKLMVWNGYNNSYAVGKNIILD